VNRYHSPLNAAAECSFWYVSRSNVLFQHVPFVLFSCECVTTARVARVPTKMGHRIFTLPGVDALEVISSNYSSYEFLISLEICVISDDDIQFNNDILVIGHTTDNNFIL
jgi:hypothetical protein